MATIKSYTSLEQSKKLAEFLPIESADMYIYKNVFFGALSCFNGTAQIGEYIKLTDKESKAYPCWSLAALLGVFPYYEINNNGVNIQLSVKGEALITEKGEYLLDLAVNMIIHLHEQNLL